MIADPAPSCHTVWNGTKEKQFKKKLLSFIRGISQARINAFSTVRLFCYCPSVQWIQFIIKSNWIMTTGMPWQNLCAVHMLRNASGQQSSLCNLIQHIQKQFFRKCNIVSDIVFL